MKTIITDGGRSASSHPKEQADCTVRALAILKSVSYDEAHALLKGLGRKDNRAMGRAGSFFKQTIKKLAKGRRSRGTIGNFAKTHPIGRFLVGVDRGGHVTSLIDGVCYDAFKIGPRQKIIGAWRIA